MKYTYDVWGNTVSITNAQGNDVIEHALTSGNIAFTQPFRYRGYCFDRETGFYYLQSRYYDPVTHRFLNADSVTDGNAGVLGYNLFAYGANNPVNNSDTSGHGIIKSLFKKVVKWVAKKIIKPIVNRIRNATSKLSVTRTKGVYASANGAFLCGSAQIGVSYDGKGNVYIQSTTTYGASVSTPSGNFGTFNSITNADSIDRLNGIGYQGGGSACIPVKGVPIGLGGEFSVIPGNDKEFYGVTLSSVFGMAGAEVHTEETNTTTLWSFNIYSSASKIYDKIMEW